MSLLLSFITALSLAALAVYTVVKKRAMVNGVFSFTLLVLSSVEVINQLGLVQSINFDLFRTITVILESLLPVSFLLLSILYGRSRPFATLSKTKSGISVLLSVLPFAILISAGTDLYFSPDFASEEVLFLSNGGYWFYLSLMVSFIAALFNIEATLAATQGIARNEMKFEAFGLMALLAVLVFYYSQSLLYRTIDMNLVPVRSSVFLIGTVLIGYSQMFRGNSKPVSISRQMFYRSVTLLVVGVYLIGLALIGEGMRYFGVSFGRNLSLVLGFAGGVLLVAILFSEKARRRATVYIRRHFYADKHDYREEWIKLTDRLSVRTSLDTLLEAIVTGYLDTFSLRGASIYLSNGDERHFVRVSGQGMPQEPSYFTISEELRAYLLSRNRVLNLNDGENPLRPAEIKLFKEARALLVVPLVTKGKLEGVIMLREQLVPGVLIYDDYDLMKVMARQAAQAIANLRLSDEVIEMRAMTAVAKISSFVIHDLKNLTSGLSLVVENAEVHMGNPDFQKDAIKTIRNTLTKMQGLMQRLKEIPEGISIETRVEDLDLVARETVKELSPINRGRIEYAGTPVMSSIDREEIKKVIINLVLNAIEASGEQGAVTLETYRENGNACIRVSDRGVGMTEDFVKSRLFRPFCTTKRKGLGIGLYQCRQIIDAHAGRVEVASEMNKGTIFTIMLPCAESDGDGKG